jgi:hypothetical protein
VAKMLYVWLSMLEALRELLNTRRYDQKTIFFLS